MKSCDEKEVASKLGYAPGVAVQSCSFVDDGRPLIGLHSQKHQPSQNGQEQKLQDPASSTLVCGFDGAGLVALLVIRTKVITLMKPI